MRQAVAAAAPAITAASDTGRRHRLPPRRWLPPPRIAGHRLPRELPPVVAQLLLARGIGDNAALRRFLHPVGVPYDPRRLAGMDDAIPRLAAAARAGETVAVFGDFDVDGITGTAILAETLQRLGCRVIPDLPDPVAEGHGLSAAAVERLTAQGAALIVTVDCGISNAAEVALAARRGAEVIITDHHSPPPQRPDAVAIVNPRMDGNEYPWPELCGAGIAYKLASGLLECAGDGGITDNSLLELAALGTIADLVPLRDENRYIVQQGLAALPTTRRPGLRELLRRCRLDRSDTIRAEQIAFQIAPRLNAAGRMAHPITSLNLLLTENPAEGERLAAQLESYNDRRRTLTAQASAVAVEQTLALPAVPSIIVSHDASYTPGINGLIAGRLAEYFNRPAVALAAADAEHLVASARAPSGFNLIEAITQCGDLLTHYGGHRAAAGFTVANANYPAVKARLESIASAAMGLFAPEPTLEIHAEGRLDEVLSPAVTQWRSSLEPFGKDNPAPVFLTRRLPVQSAERVGANGQHLKLRVKSGEHSVDALWWHYPEEWGGHTLVDLAYQPTPDRFQGADRVYLRIEDFRPAV